MSSTALSTIDAGKFIALNHAPEIAEIIEENLGGAEIQPNDLPRVKIPAGGATTWQIDTPEGPVSTPTLAGVLVKFQNIRGYWKSRKVTGSPPDCSSQDMRVGVGDPGGACKTCPLAQFGSAPPADGEDESRGQACKQRELWFLLREGDLLPLVVSLPPTSLKAARQYRTNLTSANTRLTQVITELTLEARSGPEGPYSVVVPKLSARLTDEYAVLAREYAKQMREMLTSVAADVAATGEDAGGPSDAVDLDAAA